MVAEQTVLTAPTDPVIIPALRVPQALLAHLGVQAHPDLPEHLELPVHPALPVDLVDLVVQEDPVLTDLMVLADQETINVRINSSNTLILSLFINFNLVIGYLIAVLNQRVVKRKNVLLNHYGKHFIH